MAHRANITRTAVLLTIIASVAALNGFSQSAAGRAAYRIAMPDPASHLLVIEAAVPIDGRSLLMDLSRSDEVPEVGAKGWPVLVRDLEVFDAAGKRMPATPAGPKGWDLDKTYNGILTIKYRVDYSGPAASNWPAPRETAFADANHFVAVGRSLFITSDKVDAADISFDLPNGWHAVTPWGARSIKQFRAPTADDLVRNLIVLTNSRSKPVSAGGFNVNITTFGHWNAVRPDIIELLEGVVPQLVKIMGDKARDRYSIVLLPILDTGGEAYRGSFALNVPDAPTRANRDVWGHTIAHELFHYWNGFRLIGADYPGSQWFQEGFTDYAADLGLVRSRIIDAAQFRDRISEHLAKYRRLTTPLAKPGTHKGPPLYGGGALTAFCWDIMIRDSTHGKKSLDDVMRSLWSATGYGKKRYAWADLRQALAAAPLDWDGFYDRYIDGSETLPLEQTLKLAGLTLKKAPDGSEHIELDPNATPTGRALLSSIVSSRH